jgi:hypothetical protein
MYDKGGEVMGKKDYLLIASTIKATSKQYPEAQIGLKALSVYLANQFEMYNKKFDSDKFYNATGIKYIVKQ